MYNSGLFNKTKQILNRNKIQIKRKASWNNLHRLLLLGNKVIECKKATDDSNWSHSKPLR